METPPGPEPEEWPSNPLEGAWQAFRWLTRGTGPVCVNGRLFASLPDRDVPVDELQMLLRRTGLRAEWDPLWRYVIERSRHEGRTWTIVAVGLVLPMLSWMAARLTRRFLNDPCDVHAAVLHGLVDTLPALDLELPRIAIRLRWAAYRAGHRTLLAELNAPTPHLDGFHSQPPLWPSGHPDLVLARAVAVGVLTTLEADLIGRTRLEDTSLIEWAAIHQQRTTRAQRARHRAERRLVTWLAETSGHIHSDDPTSATAIDRQAWDDPPDTPYRSRRVTKNCAGGRSDFGSKTGLVGAGQSLPTPADRPEEPRCA